MSIEIAKIPLPRVHRIVTQERADFMSHRIPGLSGNIVQDMGRRSVRLQIDGIFYGKKAKDDLDALRKVFKDRKPVDFLADLVGQAYFSQVVIEQLDVRQAATEPDQFSYQLTVVEYVPPPKDANAQANKVSIDAKLALNSKNFMLAIQVPDLLSVPNFGDPTLPLKGVETTLKKTLSKAVTPTEKLTKLFEDKLRDTQTAKITTDKALEPFDNIQQETKTEVAKLKEVENNLPAPQIPQTERESEDIVKKSVDAVENDLKTQSKALVETTAEDLNKMFESKEINDLGKAFESFKSFTGTAESAEPALLVAPQLLNLPEMVSLQVFEAASQKDWQLERLLEWCYEPLKHLPREAIPLQTVPILDELRDKLQTILGWLQKEGNDLTETFATSILEWTQLIQTAFHERTLTPIYIWLQNAAEQAEKKSLQPPLNAIVTPLEKLIPLVQSGDLTKADALIAELKTQMKAISEANQPFQEIWFGAAVPQRSKLRYLNESLELEMGRILMLAAPPKPFNLLRLGLKPMQLLMNKQGIDTFLKGLNQVLGQADDFMKSLNLKPTIDFIHQTTTTTQNALQLVQNTLKTTFEKVETGLTTVQQAVEQFQLQALKDKIKKLIAETMQSFLKKVDSFLKSVTDLISNTLNKLKELLQNFDAKKIAAEITKLIESLTNVLKTPPIEKAFTTAKKALKTVSDEINGFSIKPVTKPVIKGIETVQFGLKIATAIPLPNSAKKKLETALNKLPTATGFRAKVNEVPVIFNKMVDEQVKTKLIALQQKLMALEKEVNQFAPNQLFKDSFFEPYDKLVKTADGFKPSTLMKSVDDKLLSLHKQFEMQLQTVKVFEPLQPTLNTVIAKLNTVNFNELVQPVQKTITEKVAAITKKLPLQQVAQVMNQADLVTRRIEQGIEVSETVRIQLLHLNDFLLHLKNQKAPAQALSQQVMSKWDDLKTLEPLLQPLQALHDAIDLTTESKLSNAILPTLEKAFAQIQKYELQPALKKIADAQKAFSLEKLPDSPQKTELQNVLKDLNTALTPFNRLNQLSNDLEESQNNLKTTFSTWQKRYHHEESPLKRFQYDAKTVGKASTTTVKMMLQTMVQEQIETVLTPIFSLGEQIQPIIATHLQKITTVMASFDKQLITVLSVERDVSKLFRSVQNFVYEINHIDITFVAKRLDAILKAVQQQLKDFNLKEMDVFLKSCFTDMLLQLRPEAVFNQTGGDTGLAQLDSFHTQVMEQFRALNPKKLLREPLQIEFDKLKQGLVIFEVKDTVEAFLNATGRLQKELTTELGKTADAYQALRESIPKGIQVAK
jgi:hypothetical protein